MSDTAPIIRLIDVSKRYGGFTALASINLDIRRGEFFTLLGPSGSGKTTTLRLISGFERPDSGKVEINGENVVNTPPFERRVNTVFQDYALFPHMTLFENVAYGLRAHRLANEQIKVRTEDALDMVKLGDLGGRKPAQLSGGQRQRVALARAMVNRPEVLLLDEPLGALDLKLRHEMQVELKKIHAELGITFVYVTHDQEEALTMSDRIGVFENGNIAQIGTPHQIYETPTNAYVAKFIGLSNILTRDGKNFMIRPEKLVLSPTQPQKLVAETMSGTVASIVYIGAMTRFVVQTPNGEMLTALELNTTSQQKQARFEMGQPVWINYPADSVHFLPN